MNQLEFAISIALLGVLAVTLILQNIASVREFYLKEYLAGRCSYEKFLWSVFLYGIFACFGYHKKEHIESLKRTNKIASIHF